MMKKIIGIAVFASLLALAADGVSSASEPLVDLNTASRDQIAAVEGITPEIAAAIVSRRAVSPFNIVDDLKSVTGVTDELYLKVKDRFFVSVSEDIYDGGAPEADDEGGSSLYESAGGQDSVLEDLLANPLDLNTAQKSDLLNLPGINERLADAIIFHRRKTPFGSIEDSRKIKGFTDEILRDIRPYVRVFRAQEREIFAGDVRLRMGPSISASKPDANSQYSYPYDNPFQIYNRTRLRFGSKYEAGFIIDAARWEPPLSYRTMRELHLKKFYLRANDVFGFDRLIAGNYQLQYAQGLVFYYPYGELVRPIKVKARGIKVDTSTNPNSYFRGIAFEKTWQSLDLAGFYSYKGIYSDRNADGTAKYDLENDAKMDFGSNTSDKDIARQDKLYEELFGGRVQWNLAQNTHISVIGYGALYSPYINPLNSAGEPSGIYKFRGSGNTVVGGDFETWVNGVNIFGEYAMSSERGRSDLNLAAPYDKARRGDAWLLEMMYSINKFTLFAIKWDYDPDYINPHSSAIGGRAMRDMDYNQEGADLGAFYKSGKVDSLLYYKPVKYKIPNATANYPGSSNDFWFDIKYKPTKEYELYYRLWNHYYDDNAKIYDPAGAASDTADVLAAYLRNRYQITYRPTKSLQLKARFDDGRKRVPDYNYEEFGWLSYFDVGYKLTADMKFSLRYMIFDSPYFAMSSIDDMWPRVLMSSFWTQGRGKGRRWYLAVAQKLDRNTEIWMRYENLFFVADAYDRHTFKVQFDHKWGAVPRRSSRSAPRSLGGRSESSDFDRTDTDARTGE